MTHEEQVALIAWLRRPGVAWSAVTEQLEECGSVQAAAAAEAPAQGSLFETTQADGVDEAARDLERWERAGIRMVCVLDSEYPSNLRMTHQHPPVLFMRGTPDERDATSVAVVGTRQPTPRGISQARQLATGLAASGIPVISGLAAGIDTAAHIAALEAGGRTVVVIGTGIDRVYPPQNAGLREEITAKGLLISQFLPGSPPTKASFPMRNAVMSGYALATVVIQALSAPAPFWYHYGMAMTLRLPPEIEDQLKQVADIEHRSVQQTVLVAIEEYLSMRETAEILADPAALRGLAEARESEQAGDVVYGTEAARALLAERKR
jgi:DNA processing protein